MKVATCTAVMLMVVMKVSHCDGAAMAGNPNQFPIPDGPLQLPGGVPNNIGNIHDGVGVGMPVDDSTGSRRNDRYFTGYPTYGYNSYYNEYPNYGYASYRNPFLDYNGLVRNFDRDCADSYPNRRYSCYGYGRK